MLEDYLILKKLEIDAEASIHKAKAEYLVNVIEKHLDLMPRVVHFKHPVPETEKLNFYYSAVESAIEDLIKEYTSRFQGFRNESKLMESTDYPTIVDNGIIQYASEFQGSDLESAFRLGWATWKPTTIDPNARIHIPIEATLKGLAREIFKGPRLATTEEEKRRYGPKPMYSVDITDAGREVLNGYLKLELRQDVDTLRERNQRRNTPSYSETA
jgi:hypothetical protein